MDNRSNRPTEFLLIMLFFVGAIIASVIAVGRGQDGKEHQTVMTTFWQLHVDQASLQRDMLQIRAGLLTNYDPLVASIVSLHRDVEALEHLIDVAGTDPAQSLRKEINELRSNIDAEEQSVEEFKTRNALLANSHRIFVHLLTTDLRGEASVKQAVQTRLDGLGNLMMRFTDEPSTELAARLKLKFSALMRIDDERSQALSRHGQMVLMARPMVDAALASVQKSPVPRLIQQIEQTYVDAYVRADQFANQAKIVLAMIAFTLCGLVAALLARLRTRSQRLAEQLAFETASGLAKVGLANAEPDGFDEALQAALATFSAFFKARIAFQVIEKESGEPVEVHNHPEGGHRPTQPAWERSFQLLRQAAGDEVGLPAFLVIDEDAAGRGQIAISALVPGGAPHMAGCILTYDHAAPKLTKPLKAQLHAAMDVMVDAIRLNWTRRDRSALEQRLEHAKRLEAIGTLAGGIAHEFNNCLGALLGYGEMLRQSIRRRSKTYAYAREIVGICHRAMVTVEQILSFSRRRDRDRRPFDLSELVEDVVANLRISLSPDFELSLTTQAERLVIRGHPVEVQQIVMNLCRNAFEAMPTDKRCGLTLARYRADAHIPLSHGELAVGAYAKLSVEDRGAGIPAHLLAHLFEPFFTTKGHLGGTGLGLAVVHGSAAALAAQIDVRTSAGHGTRFDIYFPLVDACPLPMEAFFPEPAIPNGQGELIAIVDADQERRAQCEDCVAACGYEPVGLDGVSEVLERFCDVEPPALLLVNHAACSPEDHSRLMSELGAVPVATIGENEQAGATGDDAVGSAPDQRALAVLIWRKLAESSLDGTDLSQKDRLKLER